MCVSPPIGTLLGNGPTTRYTQRWNGLEVFKLGLPVNHSGQNVIHLSIRASTWAWSNKLDKRPTLRITPQCSIR